MKPYYDGGEVTVWHGDCLDVLREMADNSVDAVVTDPPYDLTQGKKGGSGEASLDLSTPYGRARITVGGGIMGQKWDATGIAFTPDLWVECLRVLKPGGHLVAFGAPRTYHRMVCAVEDAGFEIRDSLMWSHTETVWCRCPAVLSLRDDDGGDGGDGGDDDDDSGSGGCGVAGSPVWAGWPVCCDCGKPVEPPLASGPLAWYYGSGFPKSHNLSKAIDKSAGRLGHESTMFNVAGNKGGKLPNPNTKGYRPPPPMAEESARWQGWGSALKPAHEPIVLARKPPAGALVRNVVEWGVGALNVDGCRVPAGDAFGGGARGSSGFAGGGGGLSSGSEAGRWPPNLLLDSGSAAAVDRQSGSSVSRKGQPRRGRSGEGWGMTATGAEYEDSGGASRFFPVFEPPHLYTPKAGKGERPQHGGVSHPTVKPVAVVEWLVRLVCPRGGVVLDPFAGSGTTGEAAVREGCKAVLVEREDAYLPLIGQRLARVGQR